MARRSLRPVPRAVTRTCVGCRLRAAKSDLLRVVGRGNEAVPDPQARLPGRGAYLHPSQNCLGQAQRRRAFARALRLRGPALTGQLERFLAGEHEPPGQAPPGPAGPGGTTAAAQLQKAGSDRDERPMSMRR